MATRGRVKEASQSESNLRFEHLRSVALVAGLSGAGRSTAGKILSDLGFYTIDNLPLELLPQFVELSRANPARFAKLCLLLDIHSTDTLNQFLTVLEGLQRSETTRLVFLDCSTPVLVQRYSETRRPHPGFDPDRDRSLSDTIQRERSRLIVLRDRADYTIDTSRFSIHDFRRGLEEVVGRFAEDVGKTVRVNFLSFGFKHGTPTDCDLLIDVRFLPNPHFVPELKDKTGQETDVSEYVLTTKEAQEFLRRYSDLLEFLLPQYSFEGKSYLNIGVGCTGGRHRSVAIAEALATRIDPEKYLVSVKHRDILT